MLVDDVKKDPRAGRQLGGIGKVQLVALDDPTNQFDVFFSDLSIAPQMAGKRIPTVLPDRPPQCRVTEI